jgi:hypothetical protein
MEEMRNENEKKKTTELLTVITCRNIPSPVTTPITTNKMQYQLV